MTKAVKKTVKKGPRAPRVTAAAALIPDPIKANEEFEKIVETRYHEEARRFAVPPATPAGLDPDTRQAYEAWLNEQGPGPARLTKDQFRDIILRDMELAYRFPNPNEWPPEVIAQAVEKIIEGQLQRAHARHPEGDAPQPARPATGAYTPELPNFVDPNRQPETSLPELPENKSLLAYDRATHLRRNQAVTIPPYEMQSQTQTWTDNNGNMVEIQLGRDRPEPYARGLCALDEAILRAVYELARRKGIKVSQKGVLIDFEVSNADIAREVFAIPPGQYVSQHQRDEVRARMTYLAGHSEAGQPANLYWRGIVQRDGKRITDDRDHIIAARMSNVNDGWTIYSLPSTVIQANALGQLGTVGRGLLAAGTKHASHTAIRAAFNAWIIARLHDYQHTGANAEFEAKEAEAAKAEAKAEAARPRRKIWFAELLAETWAHAAIPKPTGNGGNCRVALNKRRAVIKAIVDDLHKQGAVAACRYDWNAIPPPGTWPEGTEYPTPRGTIIVTGPFLIQEKRQSAGDRKKG